MNLDALKPITPHELDLLHDCRKCGAEPMQECAGLEIGIVHFPRRLVRMMSCFLAVEEQGK